MPARQRFDANPGEVDLLVFHSFKSSEDAIIESSKVFSSTVQGMLLFLFFFIIFIVFTGLVFESQR